MEVCGGVVGERTTGMSLAHCMFDKQPRCGLVTESEMHWLMDIHMLRWREMWLSGDLNRTLHGTQKA